MLLETTHSKTFNVNIQHSPEEIRIRKWIILGVNIKNAFNYIIVLQRDNLFWYVKWYHYLPL